MISTFPRPCRALAIRCRYTRPGREQAYTRSIQFEFKAAGSAFLPWCAVKTQDIPNLNVFKTLVERKRAFTQ